jgi:hypothetical protein
MPIILPTCATLITAMAYGKVSVPIIQPTCATRNEVKR